MLFLLMRLFFVVFKREILRVELKRRKSKQKTNLSGPPVPGHFDHLQLIFNQRQRLQRALALGRISDLIVVVVILFTLDLKVETRVSRWFRIRIWCASSARNPVVVVVVIHRRRR